MLLHRLFLIGPNLNDSNVELEEMCRIPASRNWGDMRSLSDRSLDSCPQMAFDPAAGLFVLYNREVFTVKSIAVRVKYPFPDGQISEQQEGLSPDEKRALVQRILEGDTFRRSPAMRAFLLYISEHAISGRTDRLKEQTIGTEVLGRRPNYDPADDNIVRVRAHELRGRLERYFTSEGVNEPFIITIPKGAYTPEFVLRETGTPEELQPEPQAEEPAPPEPKTGSTVTATAATPKLTARQWIVFASVVLLAIVCSVAITQYVSARKSGTTATALSSPIHDFWAQFFTRPNEELKVVYADTSFALWQDLNNKSLDLGDYLNRKYLDVKGNKLFSVVMRRVTSPADMASSVNLANVANQFGGHAKAQFARDADSEFFHGTNVVLLGSHRSNPWVAIYEPSLNFQLDQDPHSGAPLFRNRSPRDREVAIYGIPSAFDTQKDEEKTYPSFGVVALLKGCGDHGLTVLVEGLNTQATQAAGDMVTDPHRLGALLKSIGHQPGTTVPAFEALFQITSMPGGYDDPKVIAYRLRAPEACVGG